MVISRFGLLGVNASATAMVISRFGLLGLNASATAMVISRFGLVYWCLTPQQQPWSYQGGEMILGVVPTQAQIQEFLKGGGLR